MTILTNARGVPYERPQRKDFAGVSEYFDAIYRYNDKIARDANQAFAEQFRKSMRHV